MALIAAHHNAAVILVVTIVALGIVSIFPHLMGSQSPLVPLQRRLGLSLKPRETVPPPPPIIPQDNHPQVLNKEPISFLLGHTLLPASWNNGLQHSNSITNGLIPAF